MNFAINHIFQIIIINFDKRILFKSYYSFTHGKEDIHDILYAEYICIILIKNLSLIQQSKYIGKNFYIF